MLETELRQSTYYLGIKGNIEIVKFMLRNILHDFSSSKYLIFYR